ncbi:hypothetical protein HMI01_26090 [Halolactibacillus miurensis]|uniref:Helix-turn-helix n=1 Tax=Halolactibacillus miurensis TaxID=306541 RepID=A0A1I6UTP0_9BACI|nr:MULTISPECIES: helix-turn-helix transcriptional regulator [Halolactibacillus]GEM05621.1 hypothetical protein HMI01_26090 [Halolactibacillus miurensis]SFT04694.1 Helix-turn-helix [Halolactibacillus miurensis]
MKELNLEYIRSRRNQLGLSQLKMAETLGFKNSSTYLKYERGIYSFKAEQLPILANILNCDISDFFIINIAKIEI